MVHYTYEITYKNSNKEELTDPDSPRYRTYKGAKNAILKKIKDGKIPVDKEYDDFIVEEDKINENTYYAKVQYVVITKWLINEALSKDVFHECRTIPISKKYKLQSHYNEFESEDEDEDEVNEKEARKCYDRYRMTFVMNDINNSSPELDKTTKAHLILEHRISRWEVLDDLSKKAWLNVVSYITEKHC